MKNIVFVGNSVANAKAIEEIRKNDKESAITFVSSDAFYPYAFDRLCAFLRREIKEKQSLYHPESFYKQNKVRVINGQPITRFNFKRGQVFLENKEQVSYDILVLADVASPRFPELKGSQKAGVYHSMRLADVRTIAEQAVFAETIIVQVTTVAGFLTACALSNLAKELVISASSGILLEILDPEASNILRQLLEHNTVRLMLDNPIEEILGDSDVKAVRFKSGKVISTEMIILDDLVFDMRPIQETGLGLSTEENASSSYKSSFGNVYLADTALNAFTSQGKYRASSTDVLEFQGAAIAADISKETYAGSLTASVTQFKIKNLTGFWAGTTRLVPEGAEFSVFDVDSNVYKKIFTSNGVLTGAVFFNADDQLNKIRELIQEGVNIQGIENQVLEDQFDPQVLKSSAA